MTKRAENESAVIPGRAAHTHKIEKTIYSTKQDEY